jgi:hypothetical protein
MAHSIYRWDYSGNLVKGIFYELEIPLHLAFEHPADARAPGTIVNEHPADDWYGPLVYGEVLFRSHRKRCCPVNASHETNSQLSLTNPSDNHRLRYNHEMDLYGRSDISKFVCDTNGMTVVVSHAFKKEISRSGLSGFSVVPLPTPEEVNQSGVRCPELFFFTYLRADCFRSIQIMPPSPNLCPFCGWGPVVCPACQLVQWNCPQCKNCIVVPESKHGGANDERFTTQGAPPNGPVIDGDKWDGSDVLAGLNQAIVTGRFVRFALQCDAAPFVAKPCLVDVSRCSHKQIVRLEAAAGPH